MSAKRLTIIWHSRTGATRAAVAIMQAAIESLLSEQQREARLVVMPAQTVDIESLLASDGFIFACPENLASMSGVMKEFFDQLYYPALDQLNGRVFGVMVMAGSDGSGAVRQIERIAMGWRLRAVTPALIVCTHAQSAAQIAATKQLDLAQQQQIAEFAQTIAAHIFLLGN